jgi:hypothetical protein
MQDLVGEELEAGDPAGAAAFEVVEDGLRLGVEAGEAGEGGEFVVVEGQIALGEGEDGVREDELGDAEGRRGAREEDEGEAVAGVVEELLKEGEKRGIGEQVNVVDDEDDGARGGGQEAAERVDGLSGGEFTAAGGGEEGVQVGKGNLEGFDETADEAFGGEVREQRAPGSEGALVVGELGELLEPGGGEAGLAEAGRGDDADEAQPRPLAQCIEQPISRNGANS